MPKKENSEALDKARVFFEKARKAAETDNFDEAIEMYIEGLRLAPEAVREGHVALRELAVLRHTNGGEKPSNEEVAGHEGGETTLEQMLGAEYLLAKDPSHLPYAERILKAAVAGGYRKAAKWIADLVFLANNRAKRPSSQIYVLLKESYAAIGRFDRAFSACERAARLKPDDEELAVELEKLSKKVSAGEGKPDVAADLVKSAKNGREHGKLEVGEDGDGSEDWSLSEIEEEEQGSEPERMPEEQVEPVFERAWVFFNKARRVADLNDFDYAIDIYLEGLRCAPEAVQEGHIPLFEMALERQRKGGKKPSMVERVKRLRGKTSLEQMLNAEYLFAKDPDHLPYGGAMLKAAVAGGYKKTGNWIANYLFQANNAAKKPSFQMYVLLKDSYAALDQFDKALAACQCAARLKPDNETIADELKDLTAELTVARGRYDQEGDFRQSIKDRESQEKLHAQESVVKTKDYRVLAVEEARRALAQEPDLPRNIYNLAQALSDMQTEKDENEAMELLKKAYKTKSDFSFAQRAGQIKIKQLKRKIRDAKVALEVAPGDSEAEGKVTELSAELDRTELEHYRLCVENYPTDLQAKYEYGTRLVRNKQYDDAIPLFQESQKDPRHKISATDKIGLCFFMKGWFADAIDVFKQAIESYEIKDDSIAKELRYNLARSYEEQGDTKEALEIYRKIAQLDFAFKDVRQRVDRLRSEGSGPAAQ